MILGIESTAHTFGIGIVEKGKILSNVKDAYTTEKGGIIPMESAKHHARVAEEIYRKALNDAEISEKEISAIAISQAPGLAPCLLEGMKFAKKKAVELNVSIIPVNHCVAHLGIGNFIDIFARHIGLGFPGGPKIMELAKSGKYVEIPYSIKGMDVAFSGLLTNLKQKFDSKKYKIEDLCYSLQETAFAMLIEASERALAHTGKKELLIGGGVACNTRLQEMCRIMCEERGCKLFCPANQFLTDNGAMIAYLGEIMFNKGTKIDIKDFDKLDINSRERTDMVEVKWR